MLFEFVDYASQLLILTDKLIETTFIYFGLIIKSQSTYGMGDDLARVGVFKLSLQVG